MDKKQQYDEIIAPMLKEVSNKCIELGFSMTAYAEWEPSEGRLTIAGKCDLSPEMFIVLKAACAFGNVDKMIMGIKNGPFDTSQSIMMNVLRGFA